MSILTAPSLRWTATLAIAGSVLANLPFRAEAADDGQWHFRVTPYLWFPAMSGSLDAEVPGLLGPTAGVPRQLDVSTTVNPDSYLSSLQMAAMVSAEASKGKWSILTDIVYTDFSNQDMKIDRAIDRQLQLPAPVSRQARMDLSATIWTLAAGYRVVDDRSWSLDLIGGLRYLEMNSDLTVTLEGPAGRALRSQKASVDMSDWDGIVGLRGQVSIQDTKWFVPFYADVGTGDSELTWQGMLGVGYRFDWGEATLVWRALGYQFDNNNMDLTMNGPGLGVSFRW
jgi:hypothetical protein